MSESNEGHEPEVSEAPAVSEAAGPEAHDGEEPKPERRVRRSRQIHTDPELAAADGAAESGGDGDAPAEAGDGASPAAERGPGGRGEGSGPADGAPKRRRRRRRRPTDGSEPRGEGPAREGRREPRDRPAGERPAGDRARGPRPPREPGARGDRRREGSALGQPVRKIYRQDVQIDPSRVQPPPTRTAPKAPPAPETQDKVTLILHPAPKAAPSRRTKKKDRPRTAKEALQAKTAKQRAPAKGAKPETGGGELKAEWIGVDAAGAADAVRAAATRGSALVQAWLESSNASALARVASLDSVGGGVRKAARRALDTLKARGVDVPVEEREAEGPAPYVATFIPPDGSGATFLSVSQRQAGGRYHVADVVMRPPLGIVHASSAKLAGKHIRDWRNRIEKDYGAKPVEVDVAWARYRIAEAQKLHETSGRPIPLGFEGCKQLLADTPQAPPPHPIADLEKEPFDQAEVEKAILGSDAIHAHPEFRSWVPDKGAVDELLSKVGQKVGGAEGASDPKVVDEALRSETAAATDRFFTPELREVIAERMRDAAISVRQRVGDETTRRILAVAKAVREAGLITSPPSEIPFLLSFFQKAVAMLVRQGQGQLRVPVQA